MQYISRREFVAASSAFATAAALGQTSLPAKLTVGEVIERIKKHVGVPWRQQTVDNLLTGTPDTAVAGIASTMMATLDVVERCVAQGKNMIVTHETPFYLHQDAIDDIKNDPVLQYKLDLCKKNNVALFHFHDHWHARHPDGIAEGMVKQLGWEKNVTDPANPKKLVFDGLSLAKWTQQIERTLHGRAIRVVGDPALPVRNVQTSWGFVGREDGIRAFNQPDLDVFICGETREWEFVEYCQDSIRMGNKKALVLLGHVLSEQGGMIFCADWLKGFIPEVPISFVPTAEPFWIPDHPVRT